MKPYTAGCCGARMAYQGDAHEWSCATARVYGLRRKPAPVAASPELHCTCGATKSTGAPARKGAGHSDWCDVERAP